MRTHMMYTQPLFVMFLTSDGTPVLAPDNIAWHRVWPKVVDARKLEPDPSSNALRAHIARFGPYAPTEGIRHPDTEPDDGWRLKLTGLSLDELTDTAAETVRALRDGIRVRGAIDKQFRPVRLHVEHDRVMVYFRWARNPNIFALAMRPPQSPRRTGLGLADVHDDAVFRTAFDQVAREDWDQLSALLDRIENHDGPLYEIVGGKDDSGIEQWPYTEDSPVIADLRWLLCRAGLILHFQPEEWQLDDAATASAEDCVRALSRMARADHWSEGAFARCFEEPDSVGRAVLRRALELKE